MLQDIKIDTVIDKVEYYPDMSIQTCVKEKDGIKTMLYRGREISWVPQVEDPRYSMFDFECQPYSRLS